MTLTLWVAALGSHPREFGAVRAERHQEPRDSWMHLFTSPQTRLTGRTVKNRNFRKWWTHQHQRIQSRCYKTTWMKCLFQSLSSSLRAQAKRKSQKSPREDGLWAWTLWEFNFQDWNCLRTIFVIRLPSKPHLRERKGKLRWVKTWIEMKTQISVHLKAVITVTITCGCSQFVTNRGIDAQPWVARNQSNPLGTRPLFCLIEPFQS